ncbi:geranylgeranyltransferase beta subunit [Suhomyces tanzawaensis NRRL Y-17324]|uniref:Geranylgeranyltransferase beta subunit n=1 Tax=Suhomyces tanzawaensis NRRL Y-17324 TaxID=984487 RepID=A0A1E4SKL4_9ASCO|nr:geranylgeranyltransferase beta subunit [Suhomyces tanzawaensis NRRL Y-17324]ODV80049.1 geranylgeranyltransferase beta subunit [Suhomyces tanzawaensis NRRL Y-17324]
MAIPSSGQMSLLTAKHDKFFNRCLQALPASLQSEDSNKLALIYFCLNGLSLLKTLQFTPQEQLYHANVIYNDFLIDNDEYTAFRATLSFKHAQNFDLASLSATYFGLADLLLLNNDITSKLDRHKIMRFVQACQVKTGTAKGSFVPTLTDSNDQFGETDLRICYIAACIRRLLKYDQLEKQERVYDIDTASLQAFIMDRIAYNGAFSSNMLDEGHLGFTFCGLACLKLLGYDISGPQFEATKNWLVHRHVEYPKELYTEAYEYYNPENDTGGFNGRENKFADTCYSWWCTASLRLMDKNNLALLDLESARDYLLTKTQNQIMGGFGKDPDASPDPFHGFLAIASLSMWDIHQDEQAGTLQLIDDELVLSTKAVNFMESLQWVQ